MDEKRYYRLMELVGKQRRHREKHPTPNFFQNGVFVNPDVGSYDIEMVSWDGLSNEERREYKTLLAEYVAGYSNPPHEEPVDIFPDEEDKPATRWVDRVCS